MNSDQPYAWRYADREMPPIPGDPTRLHIQNREIDDATVEFQFKYQPTVPEAMSSVVIGVTFFLSITSLMVFRQAAPRWVAE